MADYASGYSAQRMRAHAMQSLSNFGAILSRSLGRYLGSTAEGSWLAGSFILHGEIGGASLEVWP